MINKLGVLFFIFLASTVGATQLLNCSFNTNTLDTSGNARNWTETGTQVYSYVPSCQGNAMIGPFTNSVYLENPALQAALTATANSYSLEFDLYLDSASGYPLIYNTSSLGLLDATAIYLVYYTGTSQFWWYTGPASSDFTTHTFIAGVCYHIKQSYDGSTKIMAVNGVTEISVAHSATWAGPRFNIGHDGTGGSPLSGQLQNLVVYSGAAPTATPSPTPVPMARFTPYAGNPILVPTVTWETQSMARLSGIPDGNVIHALCWSGPYSNTPGAIQSLTSSDGLLFTRDASVPVIGQGYGGESGLAERPTLLSVGPGSEIPTYTNGGIFEYWMYYQDAFGNICKATATTWPNFAKIGVVINATATAQAFLQNYNSVGVYWTGSVWNMTVQGTYSVSPYQIDNVFTSPDGTTNFTRLGRNDYLSQCGGCGTSGRSFIMPKSGTSAGQIQDFYESATATAAAAIINIYHALMTDNTMRHFVIDPTPVIKLSDIAPAGEVAPDSIADPCLIEWQGKCYLYMTEADNTNFKHVVVAAVFPGSAYSLFTNTTPSPTITATPSVTKTPTTSPTPTFTTTLTNTPMPTPTLTVTPNSKDRRVRR